MRQTKRRRTHNVYYKYIENVLANELQVIAVGHERCSSSKKQQGPMVKNRFIIHYCAKGKGFYQLDGKMHTVNEGDCFYIPANHVITYFPDKSDPWEYYWFEYNGQIAKKITERAGFSTKCPVCSVISREEILNTMSHMIEALSSTDKADDLIAISHIYKFFYVLISDIPPEKNTIKRAKDEQLHKIFEYVSQNYSDSELSLLEIARYMNMNSSYLSRFFKEAAGIPLSKYIIDYRMHKAESLLKRKDLSVKSIAISVGYSDPLYFTREFNRYHQNTPTSYRKELFADEEKAKKG